MPVVHVAIVDESIDVASLQAMVTHPSVGAITLFLGTVREVNDGRLVTGIDYEAYRPMAMSELAAIADETVDRLPELRLAVVHRLGTLALGEISVAIAAAHPRRKSAMDATRLVIEALKQRVPIWKREHYAEGDWAWVDPTARNANAAQPAELSA